MAAPIIGSAKINAQGKIIMLGAATLPDQGVTAEDVKDPTNLATVLSSLLASVAELKSRWAPRSLDYEDVVVGAAGAVKSLQHNLAGRVRWWVSQWSSVVVPSTDTNYGTRLLWIQRALWGAITFSAGASNSTTGCRFQATSACTITGVRFLWRTNVRTVKATLWRDSDGAVLGSGTVAVNGSGVWAVTFATPVTIQGADINVDLTVGIYDQAGTAYTASGLDANFSAYLPMAYPGLLLQSLNIVATGDARPTTVSAVELFWVEPILAPSAPVGPQLAQSDTTTSSTLALASYASGTATIHVEETG